MTYYLPIKLREALLGMLLVCDLVFWDLFVVLQLLLLES